jgi:hypothetical protein
MIRFPLERYVQGKPSVWAKSFATSRFLKSAMLVKRAGVTPALSVYSIPKARGRYFTLGLTERLSFRKDALRIFSCRATGCRGHPLPPTAQVI